MRSLYRDVLISARSLRRRPWFTAIVTLGLALGIGANVATFTFVDVLLLRPLGRLHEPDRLVSMTPRPVSIPGAPGTFRRPISVDDFRRIHDDVQSLASVAAFGTVPLNLAASEHALRVSGQWVSEGYFRTLGVSLLGPGFDFEGADPATVVLGHELWRRLFSEKPHVIGTRILLNNRPFTIVGVAPEDFTGTWLNEAVNLWVPLPAYSLLQSGAAETSATAGPDEPRIFWMVGRLRGDTTLTEAQQELDFLSGSSHVEPDSDSAEGARLPAFDLTGDVMVQPGVRREVVDPLIVMLAMAGLVLLLTCANLAALLWSRVLERQGEVGVRLALGASRGELVREFLMESLLLATIGGVLGVGGAAWLLRLLDEVSLSRLLPDLPDLTIDVRVLGFALVVTILTGFLIGLAPALRASGLDPRALLEMRAGRASRNQTRWRDLLVVVQVAVALVLFTGTGLLVQTLRHMTDIDLGFEPENVASLRLDLERQGYPQSGGEEFWQRLLRRAQGLPGVESATLALSTPLAPDQGGGRIAAIQHTAGQPPGFWSYNVVGPDYFRTLRIPIREGRGFADDHSLENPVVVVNETIASMLWPSESSLGHRLEIAGVEHEVIGVARDLSLRNLLEPVEPHFYIPLSQRYEPAMNLQLRTRRPVGQVIAELRAEIRAMDRHLPVYDAAPLVDQVGAVLARQRLLSRAFGAFSILALVLATLGIYAVTAQYVRQETRALAIRLALGCRPWDVVGLVTRRALLLTCAGLVCGVLLVYFLSRGFSSLLYGIEPTDLGTLSVVVGVILLITGMAAGWPAWRATRLDPSQPLRES